MQFWQVFVELSRNYVTPHCISQSEEFKEYPATQERQTEIEEQREQGLIHAKQEGDYK